DRDFPDGLAGGLHIATRGGPLLLTGPADLDVPVLGYLDGLDVAGTLAAGYVYGGPAALADPVLDAVAEEVRGGTRTIHSAVPRLCLDLPSSYDPHRIIERPCEADHGYEVFALLEHPDAGPSHPGEAAVARYATEQCTDDRYT